jgi:hypothetical protein
LPKRIPEETLTAIEEAVRGRPEGADLPEITSALKSAVPRRTLQYRLKYLVDAGRLVKVGDDRWAKYRLPAADAVNIYYVPGTHGRSEDRTLRWSVRIPILITPAERTPSKTLPTLPYRTRPSALMSTVLCPQWLNCSRVLAGNSSAVTCSVPK